MVTPGGRAAPSSALAGSLIVAAVRRVGTRWFGASYCGDELVATTVGEDRPQVEAFLRRCIPPGVAAAFGDEETPFAVATIQMLADLEAGRDDAKRFRLSARFVPEPLRSILEVAAAIPRGQVTSYGDIARAAGTEARVVGAAMATNRLYPIVPCHRVVGADMALVGYGQRQDAAALLAKLDRLRAEARGCKDAVVAAGARTLRVYPAERVIAKAARDAVGVVQLRLFE